MVNNIIVYKLLPIVWILIVIKLIWSVYDYSNDQRYYLHSKNLIQTSDIFKSHFQDNTDFEWRFWKNAFINDLWPWYLFHIIVSQLLRCYIKIRHCVYILVFIIYYTHFVGVLPLLLIIVSSVSICLLAAATRSLFAAWLAGSMLLCFINVPELRYYLNKTGMLCSNNSICYLYQEYSLSLCMMRIISCSSFLIRLKNRTDTLAVTMHMVLYLFYLPFAFAGPFMTFDEFFVQMKTTAHKWTLTKSFRITSMFSRALFWAAVIEISSHFFYHSALLRSPHLVVKLPLWVVSGSAYMVGQFFMVKYVAIWLVTTTTSLFDGLDPPSTPRCISYVYSYADMWKYFDQGLYQFMKWYIYVPLGGSRQGLLQQIFATSCCFVFVYAWHGCTWAIFYWSLFNFVSLTLELIIHRISQFNFLTLHKKKFSQQSIELMQMLFILPTLLISTSSIFIFLCGLDVGLVIIYRICVEGFPYSAVLIALSSFSLTSFGLLVQKLRVNQSQETCKKML